MDDIITVDAMPIMSIEDAQVRYQSLVSFASSIMRDGTDFGTIPGTQKPTLLKPGAEKLFTFFGLETRVEVTQRIERWGDGGEEPLFHYEVETHVYKAGRHITTGIGSCNSREDRYRWRWVDEAQVPPGTDTSLLLTRDSTITEFKFAVEKAETSGKYGKPQEYWDAFAEAIANGTAVMGRKSAKGGKEYPCISIPGRSYRVPNDGIFSLVNTVLKMATKRSYIDACLRAVNASEFFTQDVEDLDLGVEPYDPAAKMVEARAGADQEVVEASFVEAPDNSEVFPKMREATTIGALNTAFGARRGQDEKLLVAYGRNAIRIVAEMAKGGIPDEQIAEDAATVAPMLDRERACLDTLLRTLREGPAGEDDLDRTDAAITASVAAQDHEALGKILQHARKALGSDNFYPGFLSAWTNCWTDLLDQQEGE